MTDNVWMFWILGGLAAWLVIAALVGAIIGRGIRLADGRARAAGQSPVLTTADLPNVVVAG